jgi:hypothetical protein
VRRSCTPLQIHPRPDRRRNVQPGRKAAVSTVETRISFTLESWCVSFYMCYVIVVYEKIPLVVQPLPQHPASVSRRQTPQETVALPTAAQRLACRKASLTPHARILDPSAPCWSDFTRREGIQARLWVLIWLKGRDIACGAAAPGVWNRGGGNVESCSSMSTEILPQALPVHLECWRNETLLGEPRTSPSHPFRGLGWILDADSKYLEVCLCDCRGEITIERNKQTSASAIWRENWTNFS